MRRGAIRESAGALLGAAARRLAASPRLRAALPVAILAAAVATASTAVRASVASDPRYRVSKASLAATAPPPGLTRAAIEGLARIDALPGRSFSLFEPEAIRRVAATYAALPWVKEVRAIEKRFPSLLRFDLVVRRPVAGLEHQGRTWLLDPEGVLLPRSCYEPGDPRALRLPAIVRANLGRRRLAEGRRLEDLPIRHGLAVAVALEAKAFEPLRELPITIDVSNVNFEVALNRPEVVVTAGGTVIEWGRSEASAGQNLPLEEKIANFAEAVRGRPLDRLSLVRLQFDQVEWRERTGTPAAPQGALGQPRGSPGPTRGSPGDSQARRAIDE